MKIQCKSCGHVDKNYAGYCQKCYTYFYVNHYKTYYDYIKYGTLSRVTEKGNQFGMPICHICGKAYTKLQSHIYNAHHMSKNEYCDMFGLDRKVRMTTDKYNKIMHDYALQYNMDKQVVRVGIKTRFKKGQDNHYKRSYMTMERLKNYGKTMGYKNLKNAK